MLLWESPKLAEAIFAMIKAHLASQGLISREGTIVDATIIAAPSSTKNQKGEHGPEMNQTKKGNQWYFGMKAHIGVDADSKLVFKMIGTAVHVNDVTHAQPNWHWFSTSAASCKGTRVRYLLLSGRSWNAASLSG